MNFTSELKLQIWVTLRLIIWYTFYVMHVGIKKNLMPHHSLQKISMD